MQGLSTLTAFVLAGCGSDSLVGSSFTGGGAGASGAPPGNVQGTVNAREVGGKGLAVPSAYGPDALVEGGAFTTLGSSTGAQLLIVTDDQGVVRALGISIPGSPVVIDARSTALALLLLTPGILATDPLEAGAQLAKLQALAGFAALLNFLVQNLAGSSLATLLAGAELSGLLQTVIDQFKALAVVPKFQALSLVTATPSGPAAATVVTLTNSGWRFVSVLRQPTDALGTGLAAAVKPNKLVGPQIPAPFTGEALLSGAQPASWGSLFFRQLFADATATETVDLTGGAAGLTYWFDGIGSGLNESLPSVGPFPIVENDFGSQAFGATILFYLVFPVLDFAVGGIDLLGAGPKAAGIVWAAVAGSTVSVADLTGAVRGGDSQAIKGAIVNLIHTMLASTEVLEAILKVALPDALFYTKDRVFGAKNILAFNGKINQFFTVVNVGLALTTWGLNARIGSVTLGSAPGGYRMMLLEHVSTGPSSTFALAYEVEGSLAKDGAVAYRVGSIDVDFRGDPVTYHSEIYSRRADGHTELAASLALSSVEQGLSTYNGLTLPILNGRGEILYRDTNSTRRSEYWVYSPTSAPKPLREVLGRFTEWQALNDLGQLAGVTEQVSGDGSRAVFQEGDFVTALTIAEDLGLSAAPIGVDFRVFLNNKQQLLGSIHDPVRNAKVVWMLDRSLPVSKAEVLFVFDSTDFGEVLGWNDLGQVLCTNEFSNSGLRLWKLGAFVPLTSEVVNQAWLNNAGQVFAVLVDAGTFKDKPVFFRDGTTVPLDTSFIADFPVSAFVDRQVRYVAFGDGGHVLGGVFTLSLPNGAQTWTPFLLSPTG